MTEPIARIRIVLQDSRPEIWRRLDVPLSTTLLSLHDMIQIAFDWTDSHLFVFEADGKRYGIPNPDFAMEGLPVLQADVIQLRQLVDGGVDHFVYEYDFGDSWRHDITIEGCREGEAEQDYPAFVDGARRGPPEDVGGIQGFEEFLEAVSNPGHSEYRRMIRWYGKRYDPLDIDERRIRMLIEKLAARRRGPLISHRGGRRTPVK